ncbi:MAG: flagellar basal body rod protein FlgC [Gemmatirosa sp.]
MPAIPKLGLLPAFAPQSPVRPMFRSLAISASGLSAQRQRLETIAGNLANAETTRGPDGTPYRRKVAVMQSATAETQLFGATTPAGTAGTVSSPVRPFGNAAFQVPALSALQDRGDSGAIPLPIGNDDGLHGVRVAGIAEDQTEGPLVYDPSHPDADGNGYVRYPNVRVTDEMIDLLDARRIYDANATVFQSAKAMLKKALEI